MYEKYYISLKYMVIEIRNIKGFFKFWNDLFIYYKGNYFINKYFIILFVNIIDFI